MNVDELKKYREELENKYAQIDQQIQAIEEDESQEEQLRDLESLQDTIDEQLDLLDDIIDGIYSVPRKYEELLVKKKDFERILGE